MVYKFNGMVKMKEIKEAKDIIQFAEDAENARYRYNKYCDEHPRAVPNGTMKTYRSKWRYFEDLYREAYTEWTKDFGCRFESPEEFIENYYSGAYDI